MKQLKKKKTQGKKVKAQQDPTIFNGTLVGTWKNSDIYKVTFVSGAMIVKYGNDEYKDGQSFQASWDTSTDKNHRYAIREALLKKNGTI